MSTKTMTKIIVALVIIATVCLAATMVLGVTIPTESAGGVTSGLSNSVARVLGVVKYICYAAAVIMLVMLGVKYLTASPDGKAEIKKTAVQYVIGAVLVFAAGVILTIIQSVSTTTIATA